MAVPQNNAPKRKVIVETATVRFEKRPFGMAPSKEAHGCFCTRDDQGKKTESDFKTAHEVRHILWQVTHHSRSHGFQHRITW